MSLLGTLTYQGNKFIYLEDSFYKGTRQLILMSETKVDHEETSAAVDLNSISVAYFMNGGLINRDYLISILDPVRKLSFGPDMVLNAAYKAINDVVTKAKLAKSYTEFSGMTEYKYEGNTILYRGNLLIKISINVPGLQIDAKEIPKLNRRQKELNSLLTPIKRNEAIYAGATFKDANLEKLIQEGYDLDWMKVKKYVPIHSIEDWDNLVIPAFIKAFKKWKENPDFPLFLVSMDYESNGLDAFDKTHYNPSKAVYFSIAFADDESFGVFLDMEHFTNCDRQGIAERVTYLTKKNINSDRDLTFEHEGEILNLKRSEITLIAHNMMIDVMFGLTVDHDVWFDLCTNQLSFNLDPFLTKGKNGLKHMVKKFLGIEYAELAEICGKRHMGMFSHLTDIRVIMMYGCADTDLHRLVAKKLIQIVWASKEYYGKDHVAQHMDLDTMVLNFQARADYRGIRIDYDSFKGEYEEEVRILNLYHEFMAKYVGRVNAYRRMEMAALAQERMGIELTDVEFTPSAIDNAPPYSVKKWSGKELLNVVFEVLNYPVRYKTTQNKAAKLKGIPFKPRPAVTVDAFKAYFDHKSEYTHEQIEEAFLNPDSLEKLKIKAMYLEEDFIDPVTGKVLIAKKDFNSSLHPFALPLVHISPINKRISAELAPVVKNGIEYRHARTNPTSAVTRRILNPMQTVSWGGKYKYLAYSDEYNFGAVDQAAIEIRILYGLSKDNKLILPLNDPEKDSHTETAALMHQKPAYTIDKKTRKGIKALAFGRPYGKEVWSACIDHFGNDDPENMAEMAYLFKLYDDKLESVMKVLTKTRDEMDIPVNMPKELFEYLELDPEKKYGRMRNEFGYCQHLELRENDEGYRQALRRKAGNFIIQGFAANVFRKIYLNLMKAIDREGWIENDLFLFHLPVHDEIDFSYHKSLNPLKVVKVLQEALTVKAEGFPKFYVGINFGPSWGVAKKDESELPVYLAQELITRYDKGEFPDDYDFGDHIKFFEEQRLNYFKRRIWKELRQINGGKNVWDLEFISENFHNYTVRSYLPDCLDNKILIPNYKKSDDPIEILAAYLPLYLAQHAKTFTGVKQIIFLKGKHFEVTDKLLTETYANIDDLFAGVPMNSTESLNSAESTDDYDDLLFGDDEDELGQFDFYEFENESAEQPLYAQDGIVDIDTSFLERYNLTRYTVKKETKIYKSMEERFQAEYYDKPNPDCFETFNVVNNIIIFKTTSTYRLNQLIDACRGNTARTGDIVTIYCKVGNQMTNLGTYRREFLPKLDKILKEEGFVKL